MADTETPHLPIHRHVRFELSDIDARHVFLTGVGVLVGMWIIVSLLIFFYHFLTWYRTKTTPAPPVRAAGRVLEPPEPRLQPLPERDLAGFRAMEDQILLGYHWTDRQQGTVTIPIERAIQLLAHRGIPPQKDWSSLKLPIPQAGTRRTGFAGKVEPEPR